jgi:hypothetical protein
MNGIIKTPKQNKIPPAATGLTLFMGGLGDPPQIIYESPQHFPKGSSQEMLSNNKKPNQNQNKSNENLARTKAKVMKT